MPASTVSLLRPWPANRTATEPTEMKAIKARWSDRRRELLKEAWRVGSDGDRLRDRLVRGTETEQRRKAEWTRRAVGSEDEEEDEEEVMEDG